MDKIQSALSKILNRFQSGDIPEAISFSVYPPVKVPAMNWSLINRTIMFLQGTADARGFRQWQEAGRYVKKGSKAFHILAPRMKKVKDENGDEDKALIGFLAVPVFRYEDTDGEPVEYEKLEIPPLPLIERAEEWGLKVKAIPGNYKYLGYYSDHRQMIALASPEESVFFHELAHAGHAKITTLKGGQDPLQEITAELTACVLCQMVGKSTKHLGNNYRYIDSYAKKLQISAHTACLRVIRDVERILNLILVPQTQEKRLQAIS